MPVAWPIAKFLFHLVAPNIPDIISTVATLKRQRAEPAQEDLLQIHIADMEQRMTQQLEIIETLTKQVEALKTILWRTLIIGIAAFGLALTGLTLIVFT